MTSSHPTPVPCQWSSWLAAHPAWGVVALPLLARPSIRKIDMPGIDPKHRPPFRTKLELAVEANIGAFHACLWTFTMTEAWDCGRKEEELVDRSSSPWDRASRRPSHADKRRAWRRELLGEEIRAALRPGVTEAEIQAMADRLLSLAA